MFQLDSPDWVNYVFGQGKSFLRYNFKQNTRTNVDCFMMLLYNINVGMNFHFEASQMDSLQVFEVLKLKRQKSKKNLKKVLT